MRLVAVKLRFSWGWLLNSSLGVLRGVCGTCCFTEDDANGYKQKRILSSNEERSFWKHQKGRTKETLLMQWTTLTVLQEGSCPLSRNYQEAEKIRFILKETNGVHNWFSNFCSCMLTRSTTQENSRHHIWNTPRWLCMWVNFSTHFQ
jgi:hypothetical protein